jgi:alkylated DNA repair dioxygenase AlkB
VTSQFDLFGGLTGEPAGGAAPAVPEGFRYASDVVTQATERELVARLEPLPFRDFEFRGYTGRRRVVSYGWHYDFTARSLRKADDIPPFLLDLRDAAAIFAGLEPQSLQHVLVTEYAPGAGIGWHRDKVEFGDVVGVSLLAPCVFRFRRALDLKRWERARRVLEPRSAYLLRGPSRVDWEHSIPPVRSLRYSITFRNVRSD